MSERDNVLNSLTNFFMHLSHFSQYTTVEQKCAHFCSKVVYCGTWEVHCGTMVGPSYTKRLHAFRIYKAPEKIEVLAIPFEHHFINI